VGVLLEHRAGIRFCATDTGWTQMGMRILWFWTTSVRDPPGLRWSSSREVRPFPQGSSGEPPVGSPDHEGNSSAWQKRSADVEDEFRLPAVERVAEGGIRRGPGMVPC